MTSAAFANGTHVEDLRPDVAVDPDRFYIFAGQCLPVCGRDLPVRDPELARGKVGDLGMGRDFEAGSPGQISTILPAFPATALSG